MPPKVNAKKEAGNAKKAEVAAKKQATVDAQRSAAEEREWQKGANVKRASKEEEAAAKADEAARKKREKAELLAQEEEALGSGAGKVKVGATKLQQKKGKKKDDLSLLENALVSAADKKVKKQKEAERLKKEKEAQEAKLREEEAKAKQAAMDPLLANTEKMLGDMNVVNNAIGDDDDDGAEVGRKANVARMQVEGASGIDAALGSLGGGGAGVGPASQAKSAKALYNEFEARMLPVVKEEHPGLRLTQYKEKVWALWKKSPDNPANQVPLAAP